MKRFLSSLTAFVLTLLPIELLAAIPSGFTVYCGGLPGCQGGGPIEYASSVVGILITELPRYAQGLAVFMVALGGMMMIVGVWKEDLISKGKDTITWAVIGVALSTFARDLVWYVNLEASNRAVDTDFVYSVSSTLVNTLFDLLNVTLFAVCLYCGALMVVSLGKEDQFTKGKEGLFYAALGAIVINLAKTIVSAFSTL
jgi:hypothetical protein